MGDRIYLDHHATTPVDARVLAEMLPYFTEQFGNPASKSHVFGWEARDAVELAREQVAQLIGARRQDIVFTSGATESDNLALKGSVRALPDRGRHIITCVTEHPAVLDTARRLEREGIEVTYLPVDVSGMIDLKQLEASIRPDTVLVSLMTANNEIGTLHPTAEIGQIAHRHGVIFHTDAAQSLAYVAVNVDESEVDLLSVSAHKLYGPKGVGALFVRRRPSFPMVSELDGGGHERGLRSGTLNVPGIVGLGAAAAIAAKEREKNAAVVRDLRDHLLRRVSSQLTGITVNGHPTKRLPGNLNVSFEGVDADALIARIAPIAVSTGSACSSATPEPSHVLQAIGVSEELGFSSIRFGIGKDNTDDEIESAAEAVVAAARFLRSLDGMPVGSEAGV